MLVGQDPVDRRRRRHDHTGHRWPAQQLHTDPLGPPPRMLPPHLRDLDLHRIVHPVRTRRRPPEPIRQPGQSIDQIAGDPGMHTLPRHPRPRPLPPWPSHPQDRTHSIKTLLDNRQLNRHHPGLHDVRGTLPNGMAITAGVKRVLIHECQESAETGRHNRCAIGEDFLYCVKNRARVQLRAEQPDQPAAEGHRSGNRRRTQGLSQPR